MKSEEQKMQKKPKGIYEMLVCGDGSHSICAEETFTIFVGQGRT